MACTRVLIPFPSSKTIQATVREAIMAIGTSSSMDPCVKLLPVHPRLHRPHIPRMPLLPGCPEQLAEQTTDLLAQRRLSPPVQCLLCRRRPVHSSWCHRCHLFLCEIFQDQSHLLLPSRIGECLPSMTSAAQVSPHRLLHRTSNHPAPWRRRSCPGSRACCANLVDLGGEAEAPVKLCQQKCQTLSREMLRMPP